MMLIENPLARMLETLETLGDAGRADLVNMAAIETNGMFKHPEPGNGWDPKMYEIKAHGVFGSGKDEAEAIRNWAEAAKRQVEALEQLHHAEQILRAPAPIPSETMRAACNLILTDSRNAEFRLAAKGILSALDAAA